MYWISYEKMVGSLLPRRAVIANLSMPVNLAASLWLANQAMTCLLETE